MLLKIVCDTNTLVSGFLWRGNEFRLLTAITERKALLFLSPPLLQEFARVITYPKLKPFVANANALVEKLKSLAIVIKPIKPVNAVKEDPSDNRVLECALAAYADFIVSGDKHLLKLKKYEGISIVTTKKALSKII